MSDTTKNKDDGWLLRAAAGGAVKAMVYKLTLVAMPFVVAGVTFALGWFDGSLPWMWIITGASLTFGGIAAGMFYVFELVGRRSVEGRLSCISPRIGLVMGCRDICLGINLQSHADVPVEFEVKHIRTELAGTYAPSKPFELTKYVIPPRGVGFFHDHASKPSLSDEGSVVEASLVASVLYGRPGSLNHTLTIRRKVALSFGPDGQLLTSSWNEMA